MAVGDLFAEGQGGGNIGTLWVSRPQTHDCSSTSGAVARNLNNMKYFISHRGGVRMLSVLTLSDSEEISELMVISSFGLLYRIKWLSKICEIV